MKKNDMSTMNIPQTHDKTPCKRDKDHNIKGNKTKGKKKGFPPVVGRSEEHNKDVNSIKQSSKR